MFISRSGSLLTLINVFETTPEQQPALIAHWTRFTTEIQQEPGFLAAALHKSSDGTRVLNYAQWRSQADFDAFVQKHRVDLAQFGQYALRTDPHTYEVVFHWEKAEH
ncbi:MAG TPA: antibiotic biosynthesis monooxygenase family protein [Ktedonobacteraceae bacterium]|jgi:quinol monooxygenase YgiN